MHGRQIRGHLGLPDLLQSNARAWAWLPAGRGRDLPEREDLWLVQPSRSAEVNSFLKRFEVLSGRAEFAKGSPANPMSYDAVADKFRGCAEFAK